MPNAIKTTDTHNGTSFTQDRTYNRTPKKTAGDANLRFFGPQPDRISRRCKLKRQLRGRVVSDKKRACGFCFTQLELHRFNNRSTCKAVLGVNASPSLRYVPCKFSHMVRDDPAANIVGRPFRYAIGELSVLSV